MGDYRDALEQVIAVSRELYADIKNPNQQLQITSHLIELAQQSHETKNALEELWEDYKLAMKVNAGEAIPAEEGIYERLSSLDPDKVISDVEALQLKYAAIRREIDEAVKAMGGLNKQIDTNAKDTN